MRILNTILSVIIIILFIVHGILGAFNMMKVGSVTARTLAWIMVGFILLHIILGVMFTIQTLKAQKKSGCFYFKENRLFWARRISGFAIMFFLVFHIFAFSGVSREHYRLPNFDLLKLVTQIFLVISIALHIITNIKPMLISLGVKKFRRKAGDMIFWLSVLLLFMAVAFVVYYIRWSAI